MCPDNIFANNLIAKLNGLITKDNISIPTIIGNNHLGQSCGMNNAI